MRAAAAAAPPARARTARAARRSHAARARPRSGQLGYTWKTYGPFCAPEGWHNFSYFSDANPTETSCKIRDSFGLVKAQGDMTSIPVRFHTIAPSKFCVPDDGLEGLSDELMAKRVQKLLAYNDQYKPAAQLREEGWAVPQDVWPPLTVYNTNGTHIDRAIERRKTELQGEADAEKRALRDRVRASAMVTVPAHIAASVDAKARGVMRNPDSVLHLPPRRAGGAGGRGVDAGQSRGRRGGGAARAAADAA